MEIRYVLTPEEYREGYLTMLRGATMRYRVASWLYAWPGVVVGLCLVGAGSWMLYSRGPGDLIIPVALLAVGVALVALPVRLQSTLRRLHRLQDLSREIHLTADPESLHVRRAMRDAETRYGWTAIEKSGESRNLILLFPNKVQFIPVPKRALTPVQMDELRAMIAANVRGAASQPTAAGR
jgi:YcxB-like protein